MNEIISIISSEVEEVLDEYEDAILIDLRPKQEVEMEGQPKIDKTRFDNIIWPINNDEIKYWLQTIQSSYNKEHPLILLCHGGIRSRKAAEILTDAGYQNIYNVSDGFTGWKNSRLNIEYI